LFEGKGQTSDAFIPVAGEFFSRDVKARPTTTSLCLNFAFHARVFRWAARLVESVVEELNSTESIKRLPFVLARFVVPCQRRLNDTNSPSCPLRRSGHERAADDCEELRQQGARVLRNALQK
jgi:hypothetical protein